MAKVVCLREDFVGFLSKTLYCYFDGVDHSFREIIRNGKGFACGYGAIRRDDYTVRKCSSYIYADTVSQDDLHSTVTSV
jgi:hypothetical protein